MPTNNQMSLKVVPFNFGTFTPYQYNYQGQDLSILERSLANRETRMEKAYQQMTAIDSALGSIETQLNPSESQWFYNYKNNIKNQIRNSIDSRDFGNAIRTSMSLAGQTASDSAILSRIEANKKYQEWRNNIQQRVDKGEISQDTAKWAITNNPYQFSETKDIYGNVIGGKLKDAKQVYNTINWGDIAAKAAAFNRPNVIQSESGGGGTNPALYNAENEQLAQLNGLLGAATGTWRSGSQLEQVTSKEILNTIGNILNMPDLKNQAIQDYNVSVWNYQQQLSDGSLNDIDRKNLIEQGLVKNGSVISLSDYLNEKSKLFVDALSYRRQSSTNIKENGFTFAGSSTNTLNANSGGESNNGNNNQGDSNAKGPMIEKTVKGNTQQANRAAGNIDNLFN